MITGLVAIYILVGVSLLFSYSLIGQTITPISALQILAIGGDGISVGILVFSMSVKQYPQTWYVASFTGIAQTLPEYKGKSEAEIQGMLKQFYGQLQNTTGNILKNELGATLVAISTTLGFIAAALKG